MSHLTEILLYVGCVDAPEPDYWQSENPETGLTRFNIALANALDCLDEPWHLPQRLNVDTLNGPKVFTNGVFAVCWNNKSHNIPMLVDIFEQTQWDSPDEAILIVSDESLMAASVYRPKTASENILYEISRHK